MSYIARRFMDEFLPGDIVDANRYDKAAIESKLRKGSLVPAAAPPEAKKPTRGRKVVKSTEG